MLDAVVARRIIPVVVIDKADDARPLAAALIDGGLPIAEVTLRTPAAARAIAIMAAVDGMVVGAGTVIRADQVDEAVAAGAEFIVTPGLSASVVARCVALGIPVVPGVSTATEIIAALDLGLNVLKFFPAEACGGIAALRALAAPFSDVRFIPTGGLNTGNAASYLALPAVAAIGGSWMVDPAHVASGDFAAVGRLAAEALLLHTTSRKAT
jgi:2-dehydro-3-deoxyphosphogluconate aldolase / (4S)-4-hydroxy-2-oxoglutarate aldolase